MEKIQFGPLLQKNSHATANNSIEMVLCHKDQNHQVVRNDARLNWDVYLHQPYRNDYKV